MSDDSKSTYKPTLVDAANRNLGQLGLSKDFLDRLFNEDDWSFVIKLHSLIEAVITQLLIETLGQTKLLEPFANLELSNKKSGKVAFAKELDLLSKEARSFISSLSELRNELVHNIQNVQFKFLDTHEGELHRKKTACAKFAVYRLKQEIQFNELGAINKYDFASKFPKAAIWLGAFYLITEATPKKILLDFAFASMLSKQPNK